MTKTMTPAELGTELNANSREVRKFLRSITPKEEHPGKGSRWAVPANKPQIAKLRKQFAEWTAKQAADKAARAEKAAEEAAAQVEDTDEPTDAELDALDDEELETE